MRRDIGGYFEWEMPAGRGPHHSGAALELKSGRSCLSVLLRRERPRRVLVPYYLCDGALAPFADESTEVVFYGVDGNFEIAAGLPELAADERLLCVNYFALKASYVRRLEATYGERLWVDNTQAFFVSGAGRRAPAFNSARKFFGVPDGAYLYLPPDQELTWERSLPANTGYRLEHLMLRLEGQTAAGHQVFRENEDRNGDGVEAVSRIGREMLRRIDYEAAADRRRANYLHLHRALGSRNRVPPTVAELDSEAVPFCYPYLPPRAVAKQLLWDRGVFVPVLWHECASRLAEGFAREKTLAESLLPLPMDQRYGGGDMDRLLAILDEVGGVG